MMYNESEFADLLRKATSGDLDAAEDLFSQVSCELRTIARGRLRGIQRGTALQTTVLINDVFMRLLNGASVDIQERTTYLRIAGHAMRDVVVDSIRAETAQKRGGGERANGRVELAATDPAFEELITVSETIARLSAQHPRTAQVVLLHCIGGHSREQVSGMLDLSVPTIDRELALARAWIRREMSIADECQTPS